jgi:hypothetical protein
VTHLFKNFSVLAKLWDTKMLICFLGLHPYFLPKKFGTVSNEDEEHFLQEISTMDK